MVTVSITHCAHSFCKVVYHGCLDATASIKMFWCQFYMLYIYKFCI